MLQMTLIIAVSMKEKCDWCTNQKQQAKISRILNYKNILLPKFFFFFFFLSYACELLYLFHLNIKHFS